MPSTSRSNFIGSSFVRYSWPSKVLLALGCLFFPNASQACMCGEEPSLSQRIEQYDAVFIGVLKNIQPFDSLYAANIGWIPSDFLSYFNLKVLRYNKGLLYSSNSVSVFDAYMSSCGGFLNSARIGDTLLIFAGLVGSSGICFLEGDLCTPWKFVTQFDTKDKPSSARHKLSKEELAFINDLKQWKPVYPLQNSPEEIKIVAKPEISWWNFEHIVLSTSLVLNISFLFYFIKTQRSHENL